MSFFCGLIFSKVRTAFNRRPFPCKRPKFLTLGIEPWDARFGVAVLAVLDCGVFGDSGSCSVVAAVLGVVSSVSSSSSSSDSDSSAIPNCFVNTLLAILNTTTIKCKEDVYLLAIHPFASAKNPVSWVTRLMGNVSRLPKKRTSLRNSFQRLAHWNTFRRKVRGSKRRGYLIKKCRPLFSSSFHRLG